MKHVPLDDVVLTSGGHETRDDGTCLMEAVAYYAGEAHTDHPKCVCPVLTEMGMGLNDALPDEKRVRLLQYVPKLVGTDDDGMSEARGFMAMDWIVRTYTPTWLRTAKLEAEAMRLEALSPVVDADTLDAALPALEKARTKADAAGDAAVAAAWDAARDAAWAAAGDAARYAARYAARDAAWAAAWDAARDAAWAAAGDAARYAARYAAWDAARDAAWDAAVAAARYALKPTVDELQDSAIELFARMVTLSPTSEIRSGVYSERKDTVEREGLVPPGGMSGHWPVRSR